MPLIAGLVAALAAMLKTQAGVIVVSVLVFLGLEIATYELAMRPALDMVKQQAESAGAAAGIAEWLGFLNVDRYVTIVLSAYLVAQGKRVFLRRAAG